MRKTISLFLVVSVLVLSIPLSAKERKGTDLIIQKTDETQISGELIAVKNYSLLLLEKESGIDKTVDIMEISVITIVKKSRALWYFIAGAGLGVLIDQTNNNPSGRGKVAYGVGSGLIAGLVGLIVAMDRSFRTEGKSDSEIREILEQLRKKARIKNAQ